MTIRSYQNIHPSIDASAFIDPMALVTGQVDIAKDASIWPFCSLRGDVNRISIGQRTNIQDNSVLHVTHDSPFYPEGFALKIGANVTVGHQVVLHGCEIGNSSLIGMGSVILDGAMIEENVIIGAGSLVPPGRTLSRGYLWMGSPAKQIRALSTVEIDYFAYSAQHYVNLKNTHAAELNTANQHN